MSGLPGSVRSCVAGNTWSWGGTNSYLCDGSCWKLHLMILLTAASAFILQRSSSVDFSGVWVELLANKRLKSNVYFHLKAIIWHHAGGIQGFSGLCSALIAHLLWQSCWLLQPATKQLFCSKVLYFAMVLYLCSSILLNLGWKSKVCPLSYQGF